MLSVMQPSSKDLPSHAASIAKGNSAKEVMHGSISLARSASSAIKSGAQTLQETKSAPRPGPSACNKRARSHQQQQDRNESSEDISPIATPSKSQPHNIRSKGKAAALRGELAAASRDDASSAVLLSSSPPTGLASAERKAARKARGGNESKHPAAEPEWDMPILSNVAIDADSGASTPLTWQQELLSMKKTASTDSPQKRSDRTQASKKSSSPSGLARTRDQHASQAQQSSEASTSTSSTSLASAAAPPLTWQQELMVVSSKSKKQASSAKPTLKDGPNGDASASTIPLEQSQQQQQVLHQHQHRRGHSASATSGPAQPSTPAKQQAFKPSPASQKNVAAGYHAQQYTLAGGGDLMYAGPNFHNSPSPASLPAPKFIKHRSTALPNASQPLSSFVHGTQNGATAASLRHTPSIPTMGVHPSWPYHPSSDVVQHAASSTSSLIQSHTAPLSANSGWATASTAAALANSSFTAAISPAPSYGGSFPGQTTADPSDGRNCSSNKEQTIESLLSRLMR
ncbi:hypothetical protein K437DRAFT_272131 [Tilletiaria anomala UBC 951]|uniref:Uncharacterized protein n=1 Tax=Tilletiaria anomala (strain ATCC 24038 / CBS 436.72 / UBC 951) TaxID=1037660 RepID=A0A066WGE7_TILAU|nr:uncharacterized protein K437DRAFT_272131 [Tilletiaria anomala UBC 951]KDN52831.1 hypothetical protein K437DRAFT_272131 [Tilletiaria anomala UBC 951]